MRNHLARKNDLGTIFHEKTCPKERNPQRSYNKIENHDDLWITAISPRLESHVRVLLKMQIYNAALSPETLRDCHYLVIRTVLKMIGSWTMLATCN